MLLEPENLEIQNEDPQPSAPESQVAETTKATETPAVAEQAPVAPKTGFGKVKGNVDKCLESVERLQTSFQKAADGLGKDHPVGSVFAIIADSLKLVTDQKETINNVMDGFTDIAKSFSEPAKDLAKAVIGLLGSVKEVMKTNGMAAMESFKKSSKNTEKAAQEFAQSQGADVQIGAEQGQSR